MSYTEALRSREIDLMCASKVMASEKFAAFVKAETDLIEYIYNQCGDNDDEMHQAFFEDALTALGRCVNKSLTFKLVPRS